VGAAAKAFPMHRAPLLAAAIALAIPVSQGKGERDADLLQVEREAWLLSKAFVNRSYDTGVDYYKSGLRREATWYFQRTLELVPENGALQSFVKLLQDFDNPVWKEKGWKTPTEAAEKRFRKESAAWEEECAKLLMETGKLAAAKPSAACKAKARETFVRVLKLQGGPFELGPDKRLKAGKAGAIPEPYSSQIVKEELVSVNGRLYFRDGMLKSIRSVDSVSEERGKRFLVRVEGESRKAKALADLLDQAYEQYAKVSGGSVQKPLGLFVFSDRAGFERYAEAAGLSALAKSAGFSNSSEGFAVTFEQATLEEIAVHEGAHLFHHLAFRSRMPSWYEEGFATYFSFAGSMKFDQGNLETGLPLHPHTLDSLAKELPPLRDLLAMRAADELAKGSAASHRFYAFSWALFTFLKNTQNADLAGRFRRWESFCLTAGFSSAEREVRAAELFTKIFGESLDALEKAFREWIAKQ